MVHSNNTIIWIVLILQCSDLHCLVGKIIHEILLSEKVDSGKHVSYSISMTFLGGACIFTMNVHIDGQQNVKKVTS